MPAASRAAKRRSHQGPKERGRAKFFFSLIKCPLRFLRSSKSLTKRKKDSPRQPDVRDRATVLEDRLDRKLVDVRLDVAHVDGGAQLLLLLWTGWGKERERKECFSRRRRRQSSIEPKAPSIGGRKRSLLTRQSKQRLVLSPGSPSCHVLSVREEGVEWRETRGGEREEVKVGR